MFRVKVRQNEKLHLHLLMEIFMLVPDVFTHTVGFLHKNSDGTFSAEFLSSEEKEINSVKEFIKSSYYAGVITPHLLFTHSFDSVHPYEPQTRISLENAFVVDILNFMSPAGRKSLFHFMDEKDNSFIWKTNYKPEHELYLHKEIKLSGMVCYLINRNKPMAVTQLKNCRIK